LNTASSEPLSGIFKLDGSSSGTGMRPSQGGEKFSQLFDRQVKNIEARKSERPEREPAASEVAADKKVAEPDENSEGSVANDGMSESGGQDANADREAENGKQLPQLSEQSVDIDSLAANPVTDELQETGEGTQSAADLDSETSLELITLEAEIMQPAGEGGVVPSQLVAATVKSAIVDDPDSRGVPVESTPDEPLFPGATRGKPTEAAITSARNSEVIGKGLPQGERTFEAVLNTQPRVHAITAPQDAAALVAPLPGSGITNSAGGTLPITMTLATPMTQTGWGQAVAERVVWMTNAKIQEAEIQLNPRELGPIGIKVKIQNEQASVSFVVQHSATREALEQALPRLRDMLAESGLQLGESDVSQQSFGGRDDEGASDGNRSGDGVSGDHIAESDEHHLSDEVGVGYVSASGVDAFV